LRCLRRRMTQKPQQMLLTARRQTHPAELLELPSWSPQPRLSAPAVFAALRPAEAQPHLQQTMILDREAPFQPRTQKPPDREPIMRRQSRLRNIMKNQINGLRPVPDLIDGRRSLTRRGKALAAGVFRNGRAGSACAHGPGVPDPRGNPGAPARSAQARGRQPTTLSGSPSRIRSPHTSCRCVLWSRYCRR
jgi:hypothetical protein